eukprot:COSAG06_NODE_300_length_17907_cov_7.342992_4_plen_187_part_00
MERTPPSADSWRPASRFACRTAASGTSGRTSPRPPCACRPPSPCCRQSARPAERRAAGAYEASDEDRRHSWRRRGAGSNAARRSQKRCAPSAAVLILARPEPLRAVGRSVRAWWLPQPHAPGCRRGRLSLSPSTRLCSTDDSDSADEMRSPGPGPLKLLLGSDSAPLLSLIRDSAVGLVVGDRTGK